jgi:hypothetical protein
LGASRWANLEKPKMFRTGLIFLFISLQTIGFTQRKGSIELTINLTTKDNLETFGQLDIFIKKGQRTDTLNTLQEFKKTDITKFKKATIRLNVDYGDRNAGFTRIINRKGKIRYELYFNADSTVKYIDLYALNDKDKYQEILHLNLRDQMKFEQMINLKDWKASKDMNIVFSGGRLFDLTNITQESVDYTYKDIMFTIHRDTLEVIWFAKRTEKDLIVKRKDYIKGIFVQKGNKSNLTFGQLQFYIENSVQFILKPKYKIHLKDQKDKIIEF